jgi:hypothetical protein
VLGEFVPTVPAHRRSCSEAVGSKRAHRRRCDINRRISFVRRGAYGFVLVELALPIGSTQLYFVSTKITLDGEMVLGIQSMNEPEMTAFDRALRDRHYCKWIRCPERDRRFSNYP